jgi:2-(1,2-epoxy-1,2-dihydrophenyl)acetyl-CoA isomerase
MTYQTITYEVAEGIGVLTLNRPDVMNALTSVMRAEIRAAVTAAPESARVLVLTGAGRGFCAGQDLGDRRDTTNLDLSKTLREEYAPILRAIADSPIPTIAAVNGAAAGAGANIALACDVVIASENAVFLQAFTRIGLIPDAGGTYALPRLVGMARAMGTALFADKVSAAQAAEWGMRAAHLAAGPTGAYARVKQALRASPENDLESQLALEAKLQAECGRSADFAEGVAAFLQKRKPVFTGQ